MRSLRQLGPDIQWLESFVAANKTFCVYLAKDEAIIEKHAELSGFPATKITEVRKMIDPTTEQAAWYAGLGQKRLILTENRGRFAALGSLRRHIGCIKWPDWLMTS